MLFFFDLVIRIVHVNKWPQISRDLKTTSHEEVINIQYDVPIFSYIAKYVYDETLCWL